MVKATEEMLEEAKQRYPPGTRYLPAHYTSVTCIVDSKPFYITCGDIMQSAGNKIKNKHSICEVIYDAARGWAKIISTEVQILEIY